MKKIQFQEREIVALRNGEQIIYSEIIEITKKENIFWVRPILLVFNQEEEKIIDLRYTSDLLLPEKFFQPVLDTEFINFFTKLKENYTGENNHNNYCREQLRLFINKLIQKQKIAQD